MRHHHNFQPLNTTIDDLLPQLSPSGSGAVSRPQASKTNQKSGFRTWHGPLLISLLILASRSSCSRSLFFRSSGGNAAQSFSTWRSDSAMPFSRSRFISSMREVNSFRPGGLTYTAAGYSPTCIRIAPAGKTFSSRIGLPCGSTGNPLTACQLYECRNSNSFSATLFACEYGGKFSLSSCGSVSVAIDGCTETPSASSSTNLNGSCTFHWASSRVCAMLSAARRASASGITSIKTLWPAIGRNESTYDLAPWGLPIRQFLITLGALQRARLIRSDYSLVQISSADLIAFGKKKAESL